VRLAAKSERSALLDIGGQTRHLRITAPRSRRLVAGESRLKYQPSAYARGCWN
jgi:hypothetical protein